VAAGTPESLEIMDLHHLRAFVAVADLRSFSKAARRLRLSQPPLSRHISQLERELGVSLFVRAATGVVLTREGAALLEKARTVLGEADGFVDLAARTKAGTTTALRVGMARGLCEIVNRIRVHLAARCPDIVIEGTDMASSRQYEALREQQIDLGIMRHVTDDPSVLCQPLFREYFVAVVPEPSPLARHKSLRLKDLATEPLLLHDREWAVLSHDKILALYAAANLTPEIVRLHAEPGEQASMLAVASGQGICLALRSPISQSYVAVTGVAAIPLDEPNAEFEVQVAWRRGEKSHALHEFLESARQVFATAEGEAEPVRSVRL
jgi:DNA-binding transcriptional LysR family regulator